MRSFNIALLEPRIRVTIQWEHDKIPHEASDKINQACTLIHDAVTICDKLKEKKDC